jgi:hypothetical protein
MVKGFQCQWGQMVPMGDKGKWDPGPGRADTGTG